MFKKKICLLLALLMLFACTNVATQPQNQTHQTLIDSLQREVVLTKEVERIAALDPQLATFLIMFGAGERVVAVPGGVQRNALLQELSPNLVHASIPQTSGAINVEEIAVLKPDLVFIKKENFNASVEKDLERLKIPVYVVKCDSIQDQIDNVTMLSSILEDQAKQRANAFLSNYEKTLNMVETRSKQVDNDKQISVFHSVNQAVRTTKQPSLPSDWISRMAVRNVVVDQNLKEEKSSYDATIEQLFVWNPDVILVNDHEAFNYITTSPKWRGLQAVENNKVLQLPVGVSRWGHQSSTEISLTMLWAGKQLYPELYKDIDMYEECSNFYRDVVGIELTEEMYQKIISGEGIRLAR